ncbi:MAG TPA: hypothetical protein VMZ25_04530 [Terriglobales bacterium]|nr:hypothetical protein [Terriglobales bacterium]
MGLVGLCLATSGVVTLIWGFIWVVKLLLGIAAFCCIWTAMDTFSWYRFRRRATSPASSAVELLPNSDFDLADTDDKYNHYERRVMMDGHCVSIQVIEPLFSKIQPRVQVMAENVHDLAQRFQHFKQKESVRMSAFADEILQLQVDSFLFLPDGSSPNGFIAHVYFTAASGGEPWTALWDGNDFRDLRLES